MWGGIIWIYGINALDEQAISEERLQVLQSIKGRFVARLSEAVDSWARALQAERLRTSRLSWATAA